MMKRLHSRLHFLLTILWAILAIPTIFIWHDSILWVALISVYANFVSHWGAYEGSRAKEIAENGKDKPTS